MKTTRHSLMAKGIMVLLSLLIIAFILTYSWYAPAGLADASGIYGVGQEAGADFDYAIGFRTSQTGGEYLVTDFTNDVSTALDIEHLHVAGKYVRDDEGEIVYEGGNPKLFDYNLMYDYVPIDITGDGATLIRPSMEYGNWTVNKGADDYSIAEANVQYISFDLILRSKNAIHVYLGPNSYALGASETVPDGTALIGASVARKSDPYGSFSCDAIVGAVRVAFLGFDTEGLSVAQLTNDDLTTGSVNRLDTEPTVLWVPRPDLYLNNGGDDLSTTGWSLETGVTEDDLYDLSSQALTRPTGTTGAWYTTYQHQQYDIFNGTKEVVTNNEDYVYISTKDESTDQYHLNQPVLLTTLGEGSLSETVGEDTYYYNKLRVRIWIEGTDTEARRALAKGKFNVNFALTSTQNTD